MFTLLDRVPAVPLNEGIEPTEPVAGNVELCDVSFQYDGRDKVQQTTQLASLLVGFRKAIMKRLWVLYRRMICGDLGVGLQACFGFVAGKIVHFLQYYSMMLWVHVQCVPKVVYWLSSLVVRCF